MIRHGDGGVSLTIDADDGGRITSLLALGREWLAPSGPRDATAAFVDAGTGGWDEIAPTVTACRLPDGTSLRDHGDAWRSPWTVLSNGPDGVLMSVLLASTGITLQRCIRSSTRGVRLDYQASTDSKRPTPLLWCAHPLFDASTGARIVAGPGATALTQEYPALGGEMEWPSSVTRGFAVKAFASGMNRASVVHPDGAELRMRWSLPHVGFYWDDGQFSTNAVVAIEPSTGASDSAARVLRDVPTVVAGTPLTWWITLDV